ncbi:hypothetical protein ACHAWF_012042 [Thalassiosira exigua]
MRLLPLWFLLDRLSGLLCAPLDVHRRPCSDQDTSSLPPSSPAAATGTSTLQECLMDRPKPGDAAFNKEFEKWVAGEAAIVLTRKVRITGLEEGVLTLTEVSVLDGDDVNQALGGLVSQSSIDQNRDAKYAVGGDMDTYFLSLQESSPWWEVDFEADLEVSQVIIRPNTSNIVQNMDQLANALVTLLDKHDVFVGEYYIDAITDTEVRIYATDFDNPHPVLVGGFLIDDPEEEEQCDTARVELGFESDVSNDLEVCQEFQIIMCDVDSTFSLVDDIVGDEDIPKRTTSVRYTPVGFPEDPDLSFEALKDYAEFMTANGYDTQVNKKEQSDIKTAYKFWKVFKVTLGIKKEAPKDRHTDNINTVNEFTNCRDELLGYDLVPSQWNAKYDSPEEYLFSENPACECAMFPNNDGCSQGEGGRKLEGAVYKVNTLSGDRASINEDVIRELGAVDQEITELQGKEDAILADLGDIKAALDIPMTKPSAKSMKATLTKAQQESTSDADGTLNVFDLDGPGRHLLEHADKEDGAMAEGGIKTVLDELSRKVDDISQVKGEIMNAVRYEVRNELASVEAGVSQVKDEVMSIKGMIAELVAAHKKAQDAVEVVAGSAEKEMGR